LRKLDAGALREQFARQVRQAADHRGMQHVARLRFGQSDKLGDVAQVTVGIDHQNNGPGFEQRHRSKIPDQVDGFVAIGDLIGDDGQGRQKNRVAILGGVSDIVGGDARSGPRLVFNDELLAEDRCCTRGEDARRNIGRRSGRETNHDVDGPRRIGVLRHRNARQRECGARANLEKTPTREFDHVAPSMSSTR
jgi:hypothetical protein